MESGQKLWLKDRQQEVRPVLATSQYNGNCYIPPEIQCMHFKHFVSLFYGLFIDIRHVKITWTDTIWA